MGIIKTILDLRVRQGTLLNQPETLTYINGLSTPLSSSKITELNTFFSLLKSVLGSDLTLKLDAAYDLTGETEESKLRNLIKRSHDGQLIGVPIVFSGVGINGNGSAYVKTNYTPSTSKVSYSQDSASIGVFSATSLREVRVELGATTTGAGSFTMAKDASNKVRAKLNTSTTNSSIVNTHGSVGLLVLSRTDSAKYSIYMNDEKLGDVNEVSTAPINYEMFICAYNSSGTAAFQSFKTISFAFIGSGLNQQEITALRHAVNNSFLKGKILTYFGGSVTEGFNSTVYTNRFAYLVATNTGKIENNRGAAGRPLMQNPVTPDGLSMYENMTEIKQKTAGDKYIFLHFGGNDLVNGYIQNYPETFQSQYEDVLDNIISKGWSVSDIKLLSFFTSATSQWNNLLTILNSISSSYNIQLIDVATQLYNGGNYAIYMDDAYHPNNDGHALMANYIISQL